MIHYRKVLWYVLAFFVTVMMYYALSVGDNQAFVQNIARLTLAPQLLKLTTGKDDVTTTAQQGNGTTTTAQQGNGTTTTAQQGNVTTTAQQGNVTKLKKIIYWNDFFGEKDYYFGTGQKPFLDAGCPVSACNITYDRDLFKLEELDSIIWHARSDDFSLPPIRWGYTSSKNMLLF